MALAERVLLTISLLPTFVFLRNSPLTEEEYVLLVVTMVTMVTMVTRNTRNGNHS